MQKESFSSRLFSYALPIMTQNFFIVLGTSITTLMTGRLGDIPLAAVGLANQLYNILTLVQFGVSSGSAIFTAQFWGNKDSDNIARVLGVSQLLGCIIGGSFMLIALIIPQPFLRIFTSDEQVITLGVKLLRIIGPSFLFTPIMNNYAFIMRSTGNVRLPMKVSISGILLNIVLGYALIFGVFGLPAMGAEGAAFANLIARVFECLLLIWIIYKIKAPLAVKPAQMFSFDTKFLKKVLGKVLPVTLNELLWGMGISAYAAIYAHISTESIAAVSIKDSVENLVFVPIMGITHACAIMVGNTIGSGDHEKPIQIVQQAVRIALLIAGGIGLAIVLTRQTITSFFNVSEITAFYARNLLLILGAVLWMRGLNTVFFIGMMRSGGDTRFAYWMDAGSMWFIGVPLALFAAMVLGLPVYYVNLIAMTDELVKFLISIWRYRSRRWIHNLVTS